MDSLWKSEAIEASLTPKDNADVADTGLADVGLPSPSSRSDMPVGRPQLARNQPAPPPPHQPPPPPAPQQIGLPQDSLSLQQLRKIVNDLPKSEPVVYAFEYGDAACFEEEIDEWFPYSEAERDRLRRARETFDRRWKKYHGGEWFDAEKDKRTSFVQREIAGLNSSSIMRRCKCLQTLLYVALGVWYETAGVLNEDEEEGSMERRSVATHCQLAAIKDGIVLITNCDGVSRIFDVMKRAFDRIRSSDYRSSEISAQEEMLIQEELDNVETILYVVLEAVRSDDKDMDSTKDALACLRPNLADYLVTLVAKLRWDETSSFPQTRLFLLFWKTLLCSFGGTICIKDAKASTSENSQSEDAITASPLDYHMFRKEITSKYPAYVPPVPLIKLDADNNSILPPLPNHRPRSSAVNGGVSTAANANSSGASILHQPVHIATPAPSPPPSPAIGGKAGKKQNYQTNQNFPFMYPPLDSTSSSAGGKGIAGLQEALVGRKWEGSEIPASILEAGELFAQRTKMTRATRQLWDERERFLKFERGWDAKNGDDELDLDLDKLDLELDIEKILEKTAEQSDQPQPPPLKVDYGPRPLDLDLKDRLARIEEFYRNSIPNLQSVVIVLLKAVLTNVTALITQPIYPPGQTPGGIPTDNRAGGPRKGTDPPAPPSYDFKHVPGDELDGLRQREIISKSVSGILITLLKWFKISHILKFEYLTQLLLDSNYVPLVLKLFAHSEVDKVVDSNTEIIDRTFFHFCNINSKQAETSLTPEESEDDAAPPPIRLARAMDPGSTFEDKLAPLAYRKSPIYPLPEIDELGYAISEMPVEPKTDYSWRNFFSSINYLRIMQKICKSKAHRNLLLVQYKSSNILKKSLKIPQHELRLYTLKLFKNQVPYCGRKWRQQNMRVITSVYLHCKPELRDDWLAGSDVDADIEESLPLEQALRALTHWYNVKRYPEQMGVDVKLLEEEQDFFVRELEKMEFETDEAFFEDAADSLYKF